MLRPWFLAASMLASLALAACAQVPSDPDEREEFEATNDPIEPFNRQVFDLNMALDRAIMKPVATFYRDNLPYEVRKGVHNALANANAPVIFANDLLQGKPHNAADTLGRFMINTTWGLLGIFDVVADTGGPKAHSNDFGETLAVWGVPDGPYLMLPLFGPSNPRDATGKAVEWVAPDPTSTAINYASDAGGYVRTGSDMLDSRQDVIDALDDIERNSIDFYAAIRSLYRQKRTADIAKIKAAE